jgi:hypothetical protein
VSIYYIYSLLPCLSGEWRAYARQWRVVWGYICPPLVRVYGSLLDGVPDDAAMLLYGRPRTEVTLKWFHRRDSCHVASCPLRLGAGGKAAAVAARVALWPFQIEPMPACGGLRGELEKDLTPS